MPGARDIFVDVASVFLQDRLDPDGKEDPNYIRAYVNYTLPGGGSKQSKIDSYVNGQAAKIELQPAPVADISKASTTANPIPTLQATPNAILLPADPESRSFQLDTQTMLMIGGAAIILALLLRG